MAQTFNTRLTSVVVRYARILGVKITETTLRRDLEENPYFPSLLSISDTFDRYGIPNAAYEVEGERLGQVETPFVAYVTAKEGVKDFVLVTHQDEGSVRFVYDGNREVSLSRQAFEKKYHKYVWLAEPGDHSGEPDFQKNLARERALRTSGGMAIGSAVLALLALVWMNRVPGADAFLFGSLLITKLLGTTVTVLLLLYEMGSGGAFVKNICQAGSQTDCGAVLDSKAATVAGVSWSEMGFFYFAATLSGLLFPGIPFTAKAGWLCWGSFMAMLYVPFSLYYQWRVVKQWCPLCLGVQAVLLLEGGLAFLIYRQPPGLDMLPAVTFCLLWPIVAWFFLKPLWRKAKDSDQYRAAFRRLRSNPDLFQGLLRQQAQAPDGLEGLGIVMGNPDAPIRITKVCNPYCGPCAKAHPLLEQVLERNKNVQLRMVFNARNVEGDQKTTVVKHFLAIAGRGEPGLIQKALDDWYLAPHKDYETFAKKYPLAAGEGKEEAAIDAMSAWCEKAEIAFTPTLFVNGYRLPEEYGAQELTEIF